MVRRDISSVTSDDLKRVATYVSEKRYNSKFVSVTLLYLCHYASLVKNRISSQD